MYVSYEAESGKMVIEKKLAIKILFSKLDEAEKEIANKGDWLTEEEVRKYLYE